jgi:hypothetical protein
LEAGPSYWYTGDTPARRQSVMTRVCHMPFLIIPLPPLPPLIGGEIVYLY